MKRYELSPEQWRRVEVTIPGKEGTGDAAERTIFSLSMSCFGFCVGAHWHDLPEWYGKWKTVHKRFKRWTKAELWEEIFDALGCSLLLILIGGQRLYKRS
ncbi:transposase [Thalassospira sp. SN3W]|uniref:transposase n=1 Tax=Thalassospira sp. SN3W TaxID=3035476 RepID=UPI00311AE29A